MKTSRIADEDSVSKEIKYIHTYLATMAEPLRLLTRSGNPWAWGSEQHAAII